MNTTTHAAFFPELQLDPSNGTFLAFADLLEENGKTTQAELVRAGLRLQNDITATERTLLGVSDSPDPDALEALQARYTELQVQFLEETFGPEAAATLVADPKRISFDRGVIQDLDCHSMPLSWLPSGLQVLGNANFNGTWLTSLPNDLQVGCGLSLINTPMVKSSEARRIAQMPGLSEQAKLSGLRTTGFFTVADQVEREGNRTGVEPPPF